MMASDSKNGTNPLIQQIQAELPESSLYWFFISIVLVAGWVVYLTYYNSRVFGLILTTILNRFFPRYGHIKLGSFSFAVLSGKVMFRDVHLITEDFSFRLQFGWIIFRWWRPYIFRELSEDFSHSDTRLSAFFDGLEFHVYNRSENYLRLERLFGLDNITNLTRGSFDELEVSKPKSSVHIPKKNVHWRDLIPVIKVDIATGRFVFGNHLVPNTLIISYEDAHLVYTTKPASTPFDQFMHITKCQADNVRLMFVPSPKYRGTVDEAPRYMGEGFVVLQSRKVDIYYYMDEPGVVPYEPEMVELADGETVVRRTYPCLGIDIKCGRHTDFSYGPWADRQREHLWKIFYPSDYQEMAPTPRAEPGERRQYKTMEFRMNIIDQSSIDILFSKNKETQAIHMTAGQGSYVEAVIPWDIEESGYISKIKGQLLLVEATTSMHFRQLIECETLEFAITVSYPLMWNNYQDWVCDLTACKATVWLLFHHKHFFKDLIEDWSTKSRPDIYHFIPYTWTLNLLIKEFELVTLANEYNWIDTSTQIPENAYLAFCGELFDLSLQLPFTDFLPKTVHVGLIIKGENVFCRFYLPENNTSRHVIKALAENMKIIDREGNIMSKQFGHQTNKQWRRFTNKDSGWIDCWSTTNVALSIGYMYHPMPLLVDSYRQTGSAMMEGLITTPELEEALLIPLRPIKGSSTEALPPSDFDPSTMEADVISVELEVAPSVLCLYGSLLRNFLHVKENYLGENQIYRDFQDMVSSPKEVEVGIGPFSGSDVETAPFDARDYRPFSVTVSVTLHDIQGHLVKNCQLDDIPCPCVHVQRLGFEMNKSYQQTKLQLLLSPAVLIAKDNVERMSDQKLLKEGHIGLSGLQVRGHAMFSDEGLSLDTETLEYGWLMEAVIGDITGKLTSPQLQNIIEFLQTAIMLVEDPENRLQPQVPYSLCQHMLPQPSCRMLSTYPFQCPSMDEIKYRMTRVSVDSINFFLVESGSALNLQVYPIRISTCNLHGTTTRAGITALVEKVFLKQYIATAALKHETSQPDTWMESGGMSLGPINVEAAMALPYPEFHSLQDAFLKLHDKKTERLWFLWPHPSTEISAAVVGKCGCHGGCKFFGMNRNGIGFFHPRKHKDSIPSVAVQESPEGADPGFGHSLLHKDRHVFSDIPSDNEVSSNGASSSKEFSFTRGYMSNLASPDFPLTNMTILEDQNTSDSSTMCRRSSVGGSSLEPVACVSSGTDSSLVPSEYLPDDPMPDPFDSDMTGNTTSDNTSWTLDNISLTTPTSPSTRSFTSEHTHNQDHLRCTKSSVSMPSSPPSAYRRDSKVSPFSGESMSALFMKTPSQTSLPGSSLSPHLTDSRDSLRLNSTASLESERYYSADEEMLSTSYDSHGFLSAQDKAGHSDLDQIMFGATPGRNPDETVIAMERTVLKRQVSSSSSTSTLSYMSADSEPSSDDGTLSGDMPEDFSLVDLHGQMNKPITNSTVLMSSYSNHLTCLQCNDWSVPVPVKPSLMKFDQSYYSLSSVGQSIQYIHGPACMPHFNKVRTGFSTSLMEEKTNMLQEPPPLGFRGSSNLWLPPEEESQNEDDSNETMLLQNTSKTTAVIKVKGSMDIMLTPLFLESFQRYADAVVPTLDTLHPSSIIDGLHTRCLDRLKCQNRLKKSEDNFDLNSPQQEEVKSMTENSFDGHQRTEETRTSSLQALFTLSKINICVLQSGIVEEVISFSALDDLNQITCVSLLGICIDDIKCQLLSNSHSLKTVQIQDTSPMTVPKINNSPRKRKSKKKTATKGEQVTPEREKEQVSEINQEEDVGTLSIARIHTQLRRLIKNDSLNDDMILTAIPESQSKVLFQYKKEVAESMSGEGISGLFSPAKTSGSKRRESRRSRTLSHRSSRGASDKSNTLTHDSMREGKSKEGKAREKFLSRQASRSGSKNKLSQGQNDVEEEVTMRRKPSLCSTPDQKSDTFSNLPFGFIMFENGLEEVKITAVRRLGYKGPDDLEFQNRMENIEIQLHKIQNQTRTQLESETGEKPATVPDTNLKPNTEADNNSTDSIHSWDSRISIPSSASTESNEDEPLRGDASSGVLELKTIWLNFAAPPPTSIKRKLDFTRLDWNLLSTVTPAINAWLSPLDRLMMSLNGVVRALTHRTCTVMACIMTDGLEIQGIHMPYKSKFSKTTSLSKTLQEDPSSQLLTVLRKYLHRTGIQHVENAVEADTLPQLITIQKGILALTRQWKNVLYMPQLSEMNFKSRKSVRPYTVSFALPVEPCDHDDGEGTVEHFDVVDEKTSLLQAEGGSLHHETSLQSFSGHGAFALPKLHGVTMDSNLDVASSASAGVTRPRKLSGYPGTGKAPYRPSTPVLGGVDSPERIFNINLQRLQTLSPPVILSRNESNYSFMSVPSVCSLDHGAEGTPPQTPLRLEPPKPSSILKNKAAHNQDLYRWMSKQPGEFKSSITDDHQVTSRQDSFLAAFGSTWSQGDSKTDINAEHVTMATSIMQLADAQSLFKPFLQSIGLHVESVRPSAMMKKFGGSLSLQSKLDIFKIQIASSDLSHTNRKGKSGAKSRKPPKLLNVNADLPAFLCDSFAINVAMKDVIDFEKHNGDDNIGTSKFSLNFAMHKLEAKPTTLQVNFLMNCQSVTQHVDMPLLRLLHQFIMMVENLNTTRKDLKKSHSNIDWLRTHRKQNSKDSTSSADTQQSEMSQKRDTTSSSDNQAVYTTSSSDNQGAYPLSSSDTQGVSPEPKSKSETVTFEIEKPVKPAKSLSGFRISFDHKRPDRLPLPTTLKKTHLRFTRDTKKPKPDTPGKVPQGASNVVTPPQSLNLSDSITIDLGDTSSPTYAEKTIVDEIKESTPKCWKTLYHLLELYSTMPETKTVTQKRDIAHLPVIEEEPETSRDVKSDMVDSPSDSSKTRVDVAATEESRIQSHEKPTLANSTFSRTSFKQSIYIGESIPLVVFGIAKVERVKILAVLSGLKLEAELKNVHASGTYKEKVKGFLNRKSAESSVTAHIGNTMIILLEGIPPNMQTVVTVNIAKSQALHTTVMRKGKEHNSTLVSIGEIDVDIPQHPVVLHGMMTRSSRQISSTLQEFRRHPTRSSRIVEEVIPETEAQTQAAPQVAQKQPKPELKKPPKTLHIHFKAVLQGLTTGASLLPSLKAQHKTSPITVTGMMGKKARFTVDLPGHTLSFKSKDPILRTCSIYKVATTETSIPSQASIDLPPIHVYADFRYYKANVPVAETLTEGLILKEGNYLNAVAEVGMLEHSLTTDLLNHLVFVQKVFMKEVNEVVQKVSGSDQPVPLWAEGGPQIKSSMGQVLYSLLFRFKGIQITATTPTSSAVRLETGSVDLEMSNRVQLAVRDESADLAYGDSKKVFIKAQIDLNLALGQLLKNPMFEEAEPEFQTMAFFKTKIGIRNALQDEMIPGVSTDQEALLITVKRPILLAQPLAFDKAVLVWLNYKNAYEYWAEQRMALNREVQTATRQVIDRLPQFTPTAPQALSTLFLQLTVDDLGICVPVVNQAPPTSRLIDSELTSALVLTIESTQISACSKGSLVSKGKFKAFCLRFADDFETSWDDWKPNPEEEPLNGCTVTEGTYEVCSRTINKLPSDPTGNAKWIMNVRWEMQGSDLHLDTNIGKRLSALGHTLTALAGEQEEEFPETEDDADFDDLDGETSSAQLEYYLRKGGAMADALPDFVFDSTMDPKQRARLVEKEMNEQAKIVQDLRQLGASQSTIEQENRKLEELQNILFNDFRREVLNRIKRQSERASVLKDTLGLSTKSHLRSRSYGGQMGKRRDSSIDADRLAIYNKELNYNRTGSLDHRYSQAKVQFGDTSTAYSPPVTPDPGSPLKSMSEIVFGSSPMVPPIHVEDLGEDTKKSDWIRCLQADSDSSLFTNSDDSSEKSPTVSILKPKSPDETDENGSSYLLGNTASSNPSLGSGSGSSSKAAAEPNIDFELDVKVFIHSGKCVLHPKDSKEDEWKKAQKREKTPTPDGPSSPQTKKKTKKQESIPNMTQGKKGGQTQQAQIENTVFHIPSVDVKVIYNSKTTPAASSPSSTLTPGQFPTARATPLFPGSMEAGLFDVQSGSTATMPTVHSDSTILNDQSESPLHQDLNASSQVNNMNKPAVPLEQDSVDMEGGSFIMGKKQRMKKANLYAWLLLQSLPEEMIISPSLLDFLEQALEPIPFSQPAHHSKKVELGDVLNLDLESSYSSFGFPASYASFPVDVVVFVKVDSSIIRFSCLPMSRVECLLQVPSLELVFSTKRSELEQTSGESTPPLRTKMPKKNYRERSYSGSSKDIRNRSSSTTSDPVIQAGTGRSGGLTLTMCLTDFSLYIFHPYGGGQRKMAHSSPSYPSSSSSHYLGSIQEHSASLSDIARKDSLSLNVEFMRVNISRSRKIEMKQGENQSSKSDPFIKSNTVRFSAVCDIGAAAFKHDMRRLSEILAFPKAWYRRNLARRLFLGDDSMAHAENESETSSSSSMGDNIVRSLFSSSPSLNIFSGIEGKRPTHHRRVSSGDKVKIEISDELQQEIDNKFARKGASAPQSPTDATSEPSSQFGTTPLIRTGSKHRTSIPVDSSRNRHSSGQSSSKSSTWETLVMFAINLSRLDVNVNMSNVMGNTVWATSSVKSQGRLSIDSSGHKDLRITAGMEGSHFESKGGVVGGTIDLQNMDTFLEVSEDPELGREPDHRAGLSMSIIEGRIDYMGSSVLMTRLSDLSVLLRDEWRISTRTDSDIPLATNRPALLFAHGDLGWDKFHILISRSTTSDLIKMVSKLEEFFTNQFASSKRVLSSFGSMPGTTKLKNVEKRKSAEDASLSEARHHHHWHSALEHAAGCEFRMLKSILPKIGTILGGTMTLRGNNLSLACFHGINFRSKSWAVFMMNEPYICFATEAQKMAAGEVHIVQDLTFYVGHEQTHLTPGKHMATICKLSRGHSLPHPFNSVQEWFHYAFASADIKDLDQFPAMQNECSENPSEYKKSRKSQEYNHDTEMIFALPSLQLQLKTFHLQGESEPSLEDPHPVVECSFVTEFEDHIFVAMDAEAILFLHDLVSSYIKEKERAGTRSSHSSKSAKSPDLERKKMTDPTTVLKQDYREFECKTWHLEPTVRLLHWASTQIDPVGADYILQKLGFTHARVTIPKWVQRGFMDPLDKFLSLLVDGIIVTLRVRPQTEDENDSKK